MALKADLAVVLRSVAGDRVARSAWLRVVKETKRRQAELKVTRGKLNRAIYGLSDIEDKITALMGDE